MSKSSKPTAPNRYGEAVALGVDEGKLVTISLVQRRLSLGYSEASRIIDWMLKCGDGVRVEGSLAVRVTVFSDE